MQEIELNLIKQWMYQNARPIDFFRWKFHFENGCKEDVINILSYYQNEDGGFGHALEADSWNPNSSPIQTWTATEIIREIHFEDKNHPLIQGILRYLESGLDFKDNRWLNTVLTNNDFPGAPWWIYSNSKNNFNPTAALVGFILKFSKQESPIFQKAKNIANDLLDIYMKNPKIEMHAMMCFVSMLRYINEANLNNLFSLEKVMLETKKQIKNMLEENKENWNGYGVRPSHFIGSFMCPFYQDNKELVEKELEFILKTRNSNGIWDINWQWADFPMQFPISENWWKANLVIINLLYLKSFNLLK